ncbi:OprD family outer membrane porin [Pseudomonas sp. S3_C01]
MGSYRSGLTLLGCLAAGHVMAADQSASAGFVEDSHFNILLRNAYISRDYDDRRKDKAEWGQAVIGKFSSGFTQGTVGIGVDAFGLYGARLDGGKGKSGAGGIDFFKRGDSGEAAHDLSRAGASVKFKFSDTVLSYGELMPSWPVLNYDDGRLLPESYTGTMLVSKEIQGLEVNAGHFTAQARKSAEGRDSGGLKQIDVLGANYSFSDSLSGSIYVSDVEDRSKKQYLGATYLIPLESDRSLKLDFNGYHSQLDRAYADELATGRENTIWSLAATYALGPHSFTIAHQRSSGDTGYQYGRNQNAGGVGDGGGSIFLSNSYWSDFNAEDERSWQLAYGVDFATYGMPGLTYRIAYVKGDNIRTNDGEGKEHELFNQVQYVVQTGPAKDLKLRLRGSWLRVSDNASDYNVSGNEVRAFIEYPISIF